MLGVGQFIRFCVDLPSSGLLYPLTKTTKTTWIDRFHKNASPQLIARIFYNPQQVTGGLRAPSGGGVGGDGGGGVSRRQAALSLVRQMEGFKSLDAVLAERKRYLEDMEAQVSVFAFLSLALSLSLLSLSLFTRQKAGESLHCVGACVFSVWGVAYLCFAGCVPVRGSRAHTPPPQHTHHVETFINMSFGAILWCRFRVAGRKGAGDAQRAEGLR